MNEPSLLNHKPKNNPPQPASLNSWGRHTLAAGIGLLLTLLFLFPYIKPWEMHQKLQTIDSVLVMWALDWGRYALIHQPLDYFQAPMFAPMDHSLALTHHLALLSAISMPLRLASANPILIFNLMFVLSFAATYFAMFLLAWSIRRDFLSSALSAMVFTFCPVRLHHTNGQLHILSAWWIPLFLLFLLNYFRDGRLRDLLLFALFYFLNLITEWYLAAMGGLVLGVFAISYAASGVMRSGAIQGDRLAWRRSLAALVLAGACLIPAIPLALPYFQISRQLPENTPAALYSGRGNPLAYLFPPSGGQNITLAGTWLGKSSKTLAGLPYAQFPGYAGYALFAIALAIGLRGNGKKVPKQNARQKSKENRGEFQDNLALQDVNESQSSHTSRTLLWTAIALAVIAFIFSLGPILTWNNRSFLLPYSYIYQYVSPIRFFRGVFRYNTLVMLSLAILIPMILGRMTSPKRAQIAAAALFALFIIEFFPVRAQTFHYQYNVKDVPAFYSKLNEKGVGTLLEFPPRNIQSLFYACFHRHRIYNGLGGYTPLSHISNFHTLEQLPSAESISLLNELGIRHIAVHDPKSIESFQSSEYFTLVESQAGHRLFALNERGLALRSASPPGAGQSAALAPLELIAKGKPLGKILCSRHIQNVKPANGALEAEIVGADPWIVVNLAQPIETPSKYRTLHVRMAIQGPVNLRDMAMLFWPPQDKKRNPEEYAIRFLVQTDGRMRDYRVNLNESFQWRNTSRVASLRFDPTSLSPCSARIEFIELLP